MNKQEQIEKMARIISCHSCRQYDELTNTVSSKCIDVNDVGKQCPYRIAAISQSKRLIKSGYVNGADFVEWLKENAVSMRWCNSNYLRVGRLTEALQEYLKGE